MFYRTVLIGSMLALLTVFLVPTAFAADERNISRGITLSGAPLAIHGYDPVAYFTEGLAMIGSAKHTVVHEGAAYRFVSEANMKRFEESPDTYLPQYGGFCAFGVSLGKKFDGDPRLFRVVDGKLYFNLNADIRATWLQDVTGNIEKADDNWSQIRGKSVASL